MIISDEPLEIIRQNECDDTLTGSRFRRVFQEIDRLQKREQQIAAALAELRQHLLCEYDPEVMPDTMLQRIDATIAKLGLEEAK